jgi:hypothetical protein
VLASYERHRRPDLHHVVVRGIGAEPHTRLAHAIDDGRCPVRVSPSLRSTRARG